MQYQNEGSLLSTLSSVCYSMQTFWILCRYINEEKITIYVEHPVPLDPPVAEAPAPPMPLMLTAKEKKKIRKQRREEREKERQVCISGGASQVDFMSFNQCNSTCTNDSACCCWDRKYWLL